MAYEAHLEGVTSEASEGCVLIEGDGIAVTLEPNLALNLADQLTVAAMDAMGQRKIAEINDRSLVILTQAPNSGPSSSG